MIIPLPFVKPVVLPEPLKLESKKTASERLVFFLDFLNFFPRAGKKTGSENAAVVGDDKISFRDGTA